MNKICIKCNREKDIENFSLIKKTGKHNNTCVFCVKDYQDNYREENKQRLLKNKKLYYEENKGPIREAQKLHRLNNVDKYATKDKKYYEENKSLIIEKKRVYKINRKVKDLLLN